VTIDRAVFDLNMTLCDVNGTLALGPTSPTFTFQNPTNIIIRAGGILEDQTTSKVIEFQPMSLVTLHPNASSPALATVLQTVGRGSRVISQNDTTALPRSGPFTCGILPGRQLSDAIVTFIAIQSGNFTMGSVYLGGVAPTRDFCALVRGCGIGVTSGVTLSTADLNGNLSMKIDTILIESNATLSLGTPNQPNAFRFEHSIRIDVKGVLALVSTTGNISIPTSSALNFFDGGRIHSITTMTSVQVFNPTTGANIGVPTVVNSSLTGQLYYTFQNDGTVENNTQGK
jgi:hypothetical protein